MLPAEIIRAKRDGRALEANEIAEFVRGLTEGTWLDAHVAALAMAVLLNGMTREETVALTLAMRDSGDVLHWDLDRPVVDKHSTGGVGDNVSLMLAPIVAACGVAVPMISGRGLGHTGGTLDKMEAIPGYDAKPDADTFRRTVREAGCAIIGQTGEIAPADKRFYAIRDVTGTVESVPLITASILSKKLAAGLGGLVLDVKCGNGAFMSDLARARELATSLTEVANGAGTRTTALLTDMNEPLASAAGNAVEVANAIDFLTGARRDPRLEEVTLALAAEMIASTGAISSAEGASDASSPEARRRAVDALASGRAAETFARMVSALGGPADIVENMGAHLPVAPVTLEVAAPRAATLSNVDARAIGVAVVALGGGRTDPAGAVDPAVGLTRLAPRHARLERGDRVAIVHARDRPSAEKARDAVLDAYGLGACGLGDGPAAGARVATGETETETENETGTPEAAVIERIGAS